MARTLDLSQIVSQPESYRNKEWEKTFLTALVDSSLSLDSETPQAGPDGWPYLLARTSPQATELAVNILEWLSTKGIGLVINAHKQLPDYVFTYGMIWNFKERKEFISPAERIASGAVAFKSGETIYVQQPTPQILPNYVRQILGEFFAQHGVKQPKILMISKDSKNFDLCFSLESLGTPKPEEHRGLAEAIAWFLPQHYSVLLISEKGLPEFYPLTGN